jgi:hypothetical protein
MKSLQVRLQASVKRDRLVPVSKVKEIVKEALEEMGQESAGSIDWGDDDKTPIDW